MVAVALFCTDSYQCRHFSAVRYEHKCSLPLALQMTPVAAAAQSLGDSPHAVDHFPPQTLCGHAVGRGLRLRRTKIDQGNCRL